MCLSVTLVLNELLIKERMEALRFGFDFPIQKKAAKITSLVFGLVPRTVVVTLYNKTY